MDVLIKHTGQVKSHLPWWPMDLLHTLRPIILHEAGPVEDWEGQCSIPGQCVCVSVPSSIMPKYLQV